MNFRKLCKIACVFIFLVCIQGNALAATIHGTVYEWYSFKPLENSVVEINSTPEQYFVATDAQYSFNLTPGTYLITANYFEENTVVYTAEEEVVISDEGEYVHDLLLFPAYQEDLLDQGDFENVDLDFEEAETELQASSQNMVLGFALLLLCVLLLAGYFVKKGRNNPPGKKTGFSEEKASMNVLKQDESETDESEPEIFTVETKTSESSKSGETDPIEDISETAYYPFPSPDISITAPAGGELTEYEPETEVHMQQKVDLPEDSKIYVNPSGEKPASLKPDIPEVQETSLPDDLKEIMDLIRANGNRITQRELRKKSPYSESKVSLMLSDLEERGLIEKFKRGRGNIIRIPDEEALKQAGLQEKQE